VVVERYSVEVGVGKLVVSNVGTVDLKLNLVIVGTIVGQDVHTRGVSSREVLDGVVEVELLDLGTGGSGLLHLGDDHVLGGRGEVITLVGVKKRVVRVDIPLEAVISRRRTPSDAKLHIVILEGNEWESSLPVLTEGEAERVEALVDGATVETTRDGLGGGSSRESGGDEGGVGRVLLINHLTTDKKFNLGNHRGPIRHGLGFETIVGNKVHIVEKVTLALEAHGRHTVVGDVTLDHLTFHGLGEVCMALVGRAKKADFGRADQVRILSTDSDELGDTTRHFII
jgi:hypothetical protein